MQRNTGMTSLLPDLVKWYEDSKSNGLAVPDLSVCHETPEDDILTAESICAQHGTLLSSIKEENAVQEITSYFIKLVCADTGCSDIATAWDAYKHKYSI